MNIKTHIKELNHFRQACKKYGNKKISKEKWDMIKDSIYWSPTSHGWEPYRVLVIEKNNILRNELFRPMLKQGIVLNADKLLIFISLNSIYYSSLTPWVKERVLRKAKLVENNLNEIKDNIENSLHFQAHKVMMNIDSTNAWAEKQCYIGMSFAMYTAGLLKIDSTPMEGMDRLKVKETLIKHKLIKPDESVSCALALGYRESDYAFAHYGNGTRIRDSKENKFEEI